jgi:hypothetical protein
MSTSFLADPAELARWLDFAQPTTDLHFLALIRRAKYGASSNRDMAYRVIHTSDVVETEIRRFDVVDPKTAWGADPSALVVYGNVQPICERKVWATLATRALERLAPVERQGSFMDPTHAFHSAVRTSMKEKRWIHLDVDTHDATPLLDFLNTHDIPIAARVLTRGGSHMLIPRAKGHRGFAVLTNEHLRSFDTSVCSEPSLIPLPGTRQAGFVVRFASYT